MSRKTLLAPYRVPDNRRLWLAVSVSLLLHALLMLLHWVPWPMLKMALAPHWKMCAKA